MSNSKSKNWPNGWQVLFFILTDKNEWKKLFRWLKSLAFPERYVILRFWDDEKGEITERKRRILKEKKYGNFATYFIRTPVDTFGECYLQDVWVSTHNRSFCGTGTMPRGRLGDLI